MQVENYEQLVYTQRLAVHSAGICNPNLFPTLTRNEKQTHGNEMGKGEVKEQMKGRSFSIYNHLEI